MLTIRNISLHNACKELSNKIIKNIPLNLYQLRYPSIELMMYLYDKKDEITKYSEYELFKEEIEKDSVISKHLDQMIGTSRSKTRYNLENIFRLFYVKLLQDCIIQQHYDDVIFENNYKLLESFFYENKIGVSTKLYIRGIKLSESLKIDDCLQIVKIDKTKQPPVLDHLITETPYNPHEKATHIIEFIHYEDKEIGEKNSKPNIDFNIGHKTVGNLLTCLRLFKKGNVVIVYSKTESENSMFRSVTSFGYGNSSHFTGDYYELKSAEISKFIEFYNNFINFQKNPPKPLDIALRRFNFAYDRMLAEDRIVDYLISFEALFLNDTNIDSTYRISRRIPILLEDDFNKRKEMSKKIKIAYSNRSKIVHGEKIEIDFSYTQEIQDILRKCVIRLIEKWDKFKDLELFLDSLDYKKSI